MPIPRLKIPEKNNYSDIDYSELVNKLSINIEHEYHHPPIVINIIQNNERFRFGTLGNISVIGGKGKSRKTFFVSALLASALTGNKILNIKCNFLNKQIVYFDTEQSEYDLYTSAKRAVLLNQSIIHPDNYKIFCLRSLFPTERLIFIENYLENNKNIGLILIDGIRDLLVDINNIDQSVELVTKLMQWTKVYNIHASVVLHENPGSDKLRGHLGTEIQNKAESVITIEKPIDNKEISIIKAKFFRGTKEFEDYAFQINERGLPELTNYEASF